MPGEDKKEELFQAIRKGKATSVLKLLQDGCSPNSRVGDELCTPALVLAVRNEKGKCAQNLLMSGATVDARDKSGITAYLVAAELGLLRFLELLTHFRADVNAVDNTEMTALMLAARWGRYDALQYLIGVIPEINKRDIKGRTAVMCAAIQNEDQCLGLLLDAGADLHIVDSENGYTALMHALKHRALRCVKMLLERGSKVNVVAKDGKTTVLTIAFNDTKQTGEYATVETLLQLGADMTLSRLDQDFLHEIIGRAGKQDGTNMQRLVRLMVINGCPPLDRRCWEPVPYKFSHHHMPISPLCVALLSGCYDIAKYFVVNRFFTKYDITTLPNDPEIRQKLQDQGTDGAEALDVLNHFCGLPSSLRVQSFVTISETFNRVSLERQITTQRRKLIKQSGLPNTLQEELLFQRPESRICVLHWHDLSLDTDQSIEACNCSDCAGGGGYKIKQGSPRYNSLS